MKKTYIIILVILFMSVASLRAAEASKIEIGFTNTAPAQVLTVYKALSGLTLISDSRVRSRRTSESSP